MALIAICSEGFPLSNCRCTKHHDPLQVRPCPPGHKHKGFPMDEHHHAVPMEGDKRICPRCEEKAPAKNFRGEVCGFCADILEELEKAQ